MQIAAIFNSIADRGLELLTFRQGRSLPRAPLELCRSLLSEKGEASNIALARELVSAYGEMDADQRLEFLRMLGSDFGPDQAVVLAAAEAYGKNPDGERLIALMRATEPPRQELFRRINMLPDGTGFCISLRETVLDLLPEHPELKSVDADLKHLLSSWFSGGFLELRRITWETPAIVLEKLIAYEAVHEIPGWDYLRRRLAADRRCYAFFHPAIEHDPVIFVQVALVQGMAGEIGPLLDPAAPVGDPARADTAIFYSITNTQKGLRGISFGNFLLKQVIADLQQTLPNLRCFATLSPIPDFVPWLRRAAEEHESDTLREAASTALTELSQVGWPDRPPESEALKLTLLQLCAHYLARERSRDRPLDRVARFHLGNGARLERLNWRGDLSPKALTQSAGILVNYLYDPAALERNHEMLVNTGRIAMSRQVNRLARAFE